MRPPPRLIPQLPPHVPALVPVRHPKSAGHTLAGLPRAPRPCRLPFFADPAHAGPTRSLYRALLRALGPGLPTAARPAAPAPRAPHAPPASPTARTHPCLRAETRAAWRRLQPQTSIPRVSAFLDSQYALLDSLPSATLELAAARRAASAASATSAPAPAPPPTPPRPRLTGGFLRPSLFAPPLARLRPQPEGLSMMLHNRLRARERRGASRRRVVDDLESARVEMGFYRALAEGTAARGAAAGGAARGAGSAGSAGSADWPADTDPWAFGWEAAPRAWLRAMDGAYERERARAQSAFPAGLVRRVARAARRRDARRRAAAARRKEAVGGAGERAGADGPGEARL